MKLVPFYSIAAPIRQPRCTSAAAERQNNLRAGNSLA
jgi:hypothetical protein